MSVDGATYLDASALVRLIVIEAETAALSSHLANASETVSCALAEVEVVRAVREEGPERIADARRAVGELRLVTLDKALLRSAADLEAPLLRSLDAIHIAAAQALGEDLAELITYDHRMADAARVLGLPVVAPA